MLVGNMVERMGGAFGQIAGVKCLVPAMNHFSKAGDSTDLKSSTSPLNGQTVAPMLVTELGIFARANTPRPFGQKDLADGVSIEEIQAKTKVKSTVSF